MLVAEALQVRSYTLYAKVKKGSDLDVLDYESIRIIRLEAKNPGFILEALISKFKRFAFTPHKNLQNDLPENIEFVFGPPGTGKTTYLAKNIVLPLIESESDYRCLILAPTNKAADVVTDKILKVVKNGSNLELLSRIGSTLDENLENSGVFKDKNSVPTSGRCVVVTTIARYPYEVFGIDKVPLCNAHWDYIIVDEASMIGLGPIVHMLYSSKPVKFVIAGDPFQIEPIVSADQWKDENVYSLIGLNSFCEPHTVPHDYKIINLTTQYRSVPSIGKVFSNLCYGGRLKHYRVESSRSDIDYSGVHIKVSALNIIRFPVEAYESIYKPRRLNKTPYHIYSALFTFEYVTEFAKILSHNNPHLNITIGVISPYRAEADLINHLLATNVDLKNVSIQTGTVHGFQGDECDIVFVVLNPAPKLSGNPELFLNKKNILNVSVSRARDTLFLIMPDSKTPDLGKLRAINQIVSEIKASGSYQEISSKQIEKEMFGSSSFIEDNAFTTTHQNVNVYSMPEKKYEIRTEDTAVDIQLRKK